MSEPGTEFATGDAQDPVVKEELLEEEQEGSGHSSGASVADAEDEETGGAVRNEDGANGEGADGDETEEDGEMKGAGEEDGQAAENGESGEAEEEEEEEEEEDEDDEEEDEEEEEDEDDEDNDRPRKKRRRRANPFIDIEAEDDDEEDDEDEAEEGFVGEDFITDEVPQAREYEAAPTDDSVHRRVDQMRSEEAEREAREMAEEFEERYARTQVVDKGTENFDDRMLLLPSVNDPSIWGVRCRPGKERELVMAVWKKAAAWRASDMGDLRIVSIFYREFIKGILYVEAYSEEHVREALRGLTGVFMGGGARNVFLVEIDEMPDLLRAKEQRVNVKTGSWVRLKRGLYAGDLAQVLGLSDNGEDAIVRLVPRIDLTAVDGAQRRKSAYRPPPRMFNAEEVRKIYGPLEVSRRSGGVVVFQRETYRDGFLEKEFKTTSLLTSNVKPTAAELSMFAKISDLTQNEEDVTRITEANQVAQGREADKQALQAGDTVIAVAGEEKGIYGKIDTAQGDSVVIVPDASLKLGDQKLELAAKNVRKHFKEGDHVKIIGGACMGDTGIVVGLDANVLLVLSDSSMQELKVLTRDVRVSSEVGSGSNEVDGYELFDLVQLDPYTGGVIFKIEKSAFKILDSQGGVRTLPPSEAGVKLSSRNSFAVDRDGFDIKPGDMMKEIPLGVSTTSGAFDSVKGRKGRVLHVFQSSIVFLHDREAVENGGVFVTMARSLAPIVPRSANLIAQQQAARSYGGGSVSALSGSATPGVTRFGASASSHVNSGMPSQPNPAAMNQGNLGTRRDPRIHRRVQIVRGPLKGNQGMIKDIQGTMARVELVSQLKTTSIDIFLLKEMRPDGTLVELTERPHSAAFRGGFRGGRRGGGFGGASGGFTPRAGGFGGATPAFGGATPAFGGATPAFGGATPAFAGAGSRTPAFGGGATPAIGISRTPAHDPWGGARTPAADSAWAPGSRTPAPASGADVWSASAKTPVVSDPWAAGASTPAATDSWSSRTPITSYASWNDPQPGPTPFDGPTPGVFDGPTPGVFDGPTPGVYDGPTPGVYDGPTPGVYDGPTPGAYDGPAPGFFDDDNAQW